MNEKKNFEINERKKGNERNIYNGQRSWEKNRINSEKWRTGDEMLKGEIKNWQKKKDNFVLL